ncbi:MAG: hypothetical protein CMG46_07560 [Candidatus Marinimicrobia bacterium]|nr:hypothetical protein [Candidatus Neomarinimicrobiota bacterium]
MSKVLFFPPLPDRNRLLDQLFRSIWHFLPAVDKVETLIFPYAGDDFALLDSAQILSMAKAYLNRDLDPAIADYALLYQRKVAFFKAPKFDFSAYTLMYGENLKGIIVWDVSNEDVVSTAKDIAARTGAELVWADPFAVHQETLVIIQFVYQLFEQSELEHLASQSHEYFVGYVSKWKGRPISAYGNGPSLQSIIQSKYDPGQGLRAVCNSTIMESEALKHLKPEMLFCGDPVQHCGPSLYAGRFREQLAKAMNDPGRILITQLGYVPYFRHIVSPSASSRIIGIGNDRRPTFNIDLTKEFVTAATANIFTMLVLPVVFTISKQIDVYGCDGMSFKSATKPWSHANDEDYMSKMAVTHRVHPGFWVRNYEEEFWSYCNDMEDIISQAEQTGVLVRSITPSYVPALAKRYNGMPVT